MTSSTIINPIILSCKSLVGKEAAKQGANLIHQSIHNKGYANIILATGASQFQMLEELVTLDIDWSKVIAFHLDEYIGLEETHPASFRFYLRKRFVEKLKTPLYNFHFINGSSKNIKEECEKLGKLISNIVIDVAFIGIGENGHLAFNDPPADFETSEPFIIVNLDESCRKQQLGEGWFQSLEDVPKQAITMSMRQIMKSEAIICTVPDQRKAIAVKRALQEPISPNLPASLLQLYNSTPNKQLFLYLDTESSSLL